MPPSRGRKEPQTLLLTPPTQTSPTTASLLSLHPTLTEADAERALAVTKAVKALKRQGQTTTEAVDALTSLIESVAVHPPSPLLSPPPLPRSSKASKRGRLPLSPAPPPSPLRSRAVSGDNAPACDSDEGGYIPGGALSLHSRKLPAAASFQSPLPKRRKGAEQQREEAAKRFGSPGKRRREQAQQGEGGKRRRGRREADDG